MSTLNLTLSSPSTFILHSIPAVEAAHIWISVLSSGLYIICLFGNFLVLFVVSKEQSLHKPMYLLLCMLALTDIAISTSIMPKALGMFWFAFKDTTVDGCETQMFFLHAATNMQSAVLVTMAFDRYVAICDPLRYATTFTNGQTARLGLVGLIRAVFLCMPVTIFLCRLPFCTNCVIPHTYCEYSTVVKILCGETTVRPIYNIVIGLLFILLDLTLIGLSYVRIIKSVLRISSKEAHEKAFSTCTAHIGVMLTSYTFFLLSGLTERFSQGISAQFQMLLANLCVLISSMLNPIIYGVKTKELRDKMGKYICRMGLPAPLILNLSDKRRKVPKGQLC